MKKVCYLAFLSLFVSICLVLTACDNSKGETKDSKEIVTQTSSPTLQSDSNESVVDSVGMDKTEESVNKPHTHQFGEWHVVKEPTCSEVGKKERKCLTFCSAFDTMHLAMVLRHLCDLWALSSVG